MARRKKIIKQLTSTQLSKDIVPVEHAIWGIKDKFFWCLGCKHVHAGVVWDQNGRDEWECVTPGCNGNALEAICWNQFKNHPNWVETPEEGGLYAVHNSSSVFVNAF